MKPLMRLVRIGRKALNQTLEPIREELQREIKKDGPVAVRQRLEQEKQILKFREQQQQDPGRSERLARYRNMFATGRVPVSWSSFWQQEREAVRSNPSSPHSQVEAEELDWLKLRSSLGEEELAKANAPTP